MKTTSLFHAAYLFTLAVAIIPQLPVAKRDPAVPADYGILPTPPIDKRIIPTMPVDKRIIPTQPADPAVLPKRQGCNANTCDAWLEKFAACDCNGCPDTCSSCPGTFSCNDIWDNFNFWCTC